MAGAASRDLIARILRVAPADRLTLDEIRMHPWVNDQCATLTPFYRYARCPGARARSLPILIGSGYGRTPAELARADPVSAATHALARLTVRTSPPAAHTVVVPTLAAGVHAVRHQQSVSVPTSPRASVTGPSGLDTAARPVPPPAPVVGAGFVLPSHAATDAALVAAAALRGRRHSGAGMAPLLSGRPARPLPVSDDPAVVRYLQARLRRVHAHTHTHTLSLSWCGSLLTCPWTPLPALGAAQSGPPRIRCGCRGARACPLTAPSCLEEPHPRCAVDDDGPSHRRNAHRGAPGAPRVSGRALGAPCSDGRHGHCGCWTTLYALAQPLERAC
jgi:hypothetical protein